MNAALFIHSYPGGNAILKRHWPHFQHSGLPLFGVGPRNGRTVWPETIPNRGIASDAYVGRPDLSYKMVGTYEWFVNDPIFNAYDYAWIVEYDALFLKPAPAVTSDAAATLSGGPVEGHLARSFYHGPWILSRPACHRFVSKGYELINKGQHENGSPDFFFSLVFERLREKITPLQGTFSVNGGDFCNRMDAAERAIKAGAWYVHGLRTKDELNWCLAQMPP